MLKKFLNSIWQGWKKFARVFGRINSHILLSLFYFLIFGLVAIIKKIVKLFFKKVKKESYWIEKEDNGEVNFEKQF